MTRTKEWAVLDNTVNFESPSHTGTLLTGLNTLRAKGQLLDVTLVAEGEAFQVICNEFLSRLCSTTCVILLILLFFH